MMWEANHRPGLRYFMVFFVSVYTSIGIKKGPRGGGGVGGKLKEEEKARQQGQESKKKKREKNYVPGTSAKTKCPEIFRSCR